MPKKKSKKGILSTDIPYETSLEKIKGKKKKSGKKPPASKSFKERGKLPAFRDSLGKLGGLKTADINIIESMAATPKEISMWLSGASDVSPTKLNKAIKEVNQKILWVMAYAHLQELSRFFMLRQKQARIEEKLYDEEKLNEFQGFSVEELMEMRKTIHVQMQQILDNSRRFIAQNRAELDDTARGGDNAIEIIRSMTPDALQELSDTLRGV